MFSFLICTIFRIRFRFSKYLGNVHLLFIWTFRPHFFHFASSFFLLHLCFIFLPSLHLCPIFLPSLHRMHCLILIFPIAPLALLNIPSVQLSLIFLPDHCTFASSLYSLIANLPHLSPLILPLPYPSVLISHLSLNIFHSHILFIPYYF